MKSIELTDAAISKAIEKTQGDCRQNIRVGVSPSGCAGYKYVIEFTDTISECDTVLDYDKFRIVIDQQSERFLIGAKLDWVKEGLNENFKIINPNEDSSCGCGLSITFK